MVNNGWFPTCGTCGFPIGLCICCIEDFPTAEDWAVVQAFRRECMPEYFTTFMLAHVPCRDKDGYLMMIPIEALANADV